MKKNILYLATLLLALPFMAACSPDDGTTPGGDSQPVATVYTYSDPGEGYNADNDCHFRVATNSVASETYYLAELSSDKEARKMTDDEYAAYVQEHGTKIDVKANDYKDVYLKDLHGEYTISVVGVNGNARSLRSFDFAGLDYKPWGTGSYTSAFLGGTFSVDIDYSAVGGRYRVKDVYDNGYNVVFTIDGSAVTVIPSKFETGLKHTKYGMVSATDKGCTYDEASSTVTLNFDMTVSVGSFGTMTEVLVMKKN